MDAVKPPIFEVKITGEVSPETVPASVLGEFITLIEKAVLAVIGEDQENHKDFALVSLVDVQRGSDWLHFSSPPTVIPAVGAITQAITERNFELIPSRAHRYLYDANRLCHRRGWGLEFLPNEKYSIIAASIPEDQLIPPPRKPVKSKGTTTIIGRVIRTGGVEPKVHIKLMNSDNSLHIGVSEEQAKNLANRLYEVVALDCAVTWSTEDWSFDPHSISVIDISSYTKPRSPARAFSRLREISGDTWDNFDISKLSEDSEGMIN